MPMAGFCFNFVVVVVVFEYSLNRKKQDYI